MKALLYNSVMSISSRRQQNPEPPITLSKTLIDILNALNQHPGPHPAVLASLIRSASTNDIDDVLQAQTRDQYSTLHNVLMFKDPMIFLALIEKASETGLNAALRLQNKFQSTVLDTALSLAETPVMLALIRKASSEVIDETLLVRNMHECTALHTAIARQSEECIIALIDKASSESVSAALFVANTEGDYPLHLAAQRLSQRAFTALVNKARPAALDLAIGFKINDEWTGLKMCAKYLYEAGFIALMENTSGAAIDETVYSELKDEWTSLHAAAYYLSNEAFSALVNKMSRDALNAALFIRDGRGQSTLALLLKMRPEKAVAFLKRSEPNDEEIESRVRYVMSGIISYSALEHSEWKPERPLDKSAGNAKEEKSGAQSRVAQIKSEIYGKNDWRLSIFGSRYKLEGKGITHTAARILEIIGEAEKSTERNRWDVALDRVQGCLENRPKLGVINRYQESDEFYDGLAARCLR